jgi:FMN phosphatase YigB (HAD superfamily)
MALDMHIPEIMSGARFVDPISHVRQLVDTGKFRVLSLDIFDTTVWRAFPAPTDLFYSLGYLARERGLLYSSASGASFGAERIEAEREARARRGADGEVTLEEIYRRFPRGYIRQGSPDDLLRCELDLERQSTFPDSEIVSLIDYASSKGLRIAFVSDTYFDEEHLRRILPRPGNFLIASSRFRRSKAHGLHRELIDRAGVKAGQILHVGDNHGADVAAPAQLGVQAVWRPRFPNAFATAIQAELPLTRSERAPFFATTTGDAGLNAIRAQAVEAAANWTDPVRAWGALFLGPVMTGFAKWVGERCRDVQIDTALCLMREGKIIKLVLDGVGGGVATHEFYTSRFALLTASIFRGEESELTKFLARPQPARALELLAPLGLAPAQVDLDDDALVPAEAAYQLARKIASDPEMRAQACEASAEARRRFLLYLRETLPDLPSRVAVVDLGYSGTIQTCLQAILDHEKIACQTHGLYFVTGSGIRKVQQAGACAEGFLAENGQPLAIAHSFMRSPELVEQCLMCSLGSTIAYDESGLPVLGQQHLPATQLASIQQVQEGLLDYVKCFAKTPTLRETDSSTLRPFLEAILVRALTVPTPAELKVFGQWVHDENLGSSRTRPLIASDLDPDYLYYASAHQLASLASSSAYWIFGLAQNDSPMTGEAVRSIFLRKTQPEAFSCHEQERKLHFFWNDGEAHRADRNYTLSNRRTAWTRFALDIQNSELREIGFSLGRPGDVIKVGGVILRLNRAGSPVEVIREPLEELQTFGLEPLKGSQGTYLVTDTAGIIAEIRDVRDFTGVVQVDLLFAHLPAGDPCPS